MPDSERADRALGLALSGVERLQARQEPVVGSGCDVSRTGFEPTARAIVLSYETEVPPGTVQTRAVLPSGGPF